MTTSFRPARLKNPFVEGIEEHVFVSPFDRSEQTFLQKDFRVSERSAPLVVIFLHGAASRQDQGMTAGLYGGALERWRDELARREAVYICPDYRGGSWMGPAAEADVVEIIGQVRPRLRPGKIILMGGSMGGTSALIFAARHPELIDGVIALCPATEVASLFEAFSAQFRASYGGSPQEVPGIYAERRSRDHAKTLARLPVAMVHGAADAVIPVEHSRVLVRRLQEEGGRCLYVEQPGGDHDAPVHAPLSELLDFILATAPGETW